MHIRHHTPALALVTAMLMPLISASADERPNILWIVAEDISPFFGCYGDPDASTPTIDALAEHSHLFTNALTTAPICAPSRSCLATGIYATSLGTQHLRSIVEIPGAIRTLPQVFRENGYWTVLRGKSDFNFEAEGLFDSRDEGSAPWQECPDGKPFFAFMNLGSTHEGSGNIASRAASALERLPEDRLHDPQEVALPPYYHDTGEMRRIWARYHDLISVWDMDVKSVLDQLEADGRAENTIIFLMADHGLGLPRYKRWLYKTGLHVPLIIHLPEKFSDWAPEGTAGAKHDELISYVDLPPTALALAGIPIPKNYEGHSIFTKGGEEIAARKYAFGARDRADDMYDLSRCVFDGRFLYIRHFMPHLPPIQEGIIFSPTKKESLVELHRVHDAGKDSKHSALLWAPRPFEELYDLERDPEELVNLAGNPKVAHTKAVLAGVLRDWILKTRDSGFLPEPEMHRRATAAGLTPYEMLQDKSLYPLERILSVAETASRGEEFGPESFESNDPAVRYWALLAAIIADRDDDAAEALFERAIKDPNPVVRATAAEGLGRIGLAHLAIPVFRELLGETEPNLALFIARSLAVSLDDVRPLEKAIRQARERYLSPPGSERPWKDFFYSAFTCWALEWSLIKSGLNEYSDFEN